MGRLRDAVVVLEVGLSLTLLVSAGLLMRSFVALREVHLGLQPDHVLVARLPLPTDRYKTADQVTGFYRPLLATAESVAWYRGSDGNQHAASVWRDSERHRDSRQDARGKNGTRCFKLVSEGYFPVLKNPVSWTEGGFTEAEINGSAQAGDCEPDVCEKSIWAKRIRSGNR